MRQGSGEVLQFRASLMLVKSTRSNDGIVGCVPPQPDSPMPSDTYKPPRKLPPQAASLCPTHVRKPPVGERPRPSINWQPPDTELCLRAARRTSHRSRPRGRRDRRQRGHRHRGLGDALGVGGVYATEPRLFAPKQPFAPGWSDWQLRADCVEKVGANHFGATLIHKHRLVRSMMTFRWLRA